jgi:hypothetical protein
MKHAHLAVLRVDDRYKFRRMGEQKSGTTNVAVGAGRAWQKRASRATANARPGPNIIERGVEGERE